MKVIKRLWHFSWIQGMENVCMRKDGMLKYPEERAVDPLCSLRWKPSFLNSINYRVTSTSSASDPCIFFYCKKYSHNPNPIGLPQDLHEPITRPSSCLHNGAPATAEAVAPSPGPITSPPHCLWLHREWEIKYNALTSNPQCKRGSEEEGILSEPRKHIHGYVSQCQLPEWRETRGESTQPEV